MNLARSFFLVVALAACSGSNNNDVFDLAQALPDLATPGADLGPLPPRDPTDHPTQWIMNNYHGPLLTAAELWTVVWQGQEELGERTNLFLDWMVQSDDYWLASVGEYGVGKGHAMGVRVLPTTAPGTIDDRQLPALINQMIAQGVLPTPNAQTAFVFVLPSSTRSTMQGQRGCRSYEGYHSEAQLDAGGTVPYLVNLQCASFGGVATFDALTEVISHEVSETATDPHPFSAPGYTNRIAPLGGEISDLCAGLAAIFQATQDVPDGSVTNQYFVTRNWSNRNSTSGAADPCQPVVNGKPYFNVGFSPPDLELLPDANGPITVEAEYQPFAFGDVGLIKWELASDPGNGVSISPASGSGMAGDTVRVTVTIDSTAVSGIYPVYIIASSARGGDNQWVGKIIVD